MLKSRHVETGRVTAPKTCDVSDVLFWRAASLQLRGLLMRSALSEARATSDASGNVRLAKKSEAGKTATG